MRIGTLFSGIGCPEQAIKNVHKEHDLVFACEFDKFARESFKANYDIKDNHFHVDINDMDGKQYKDKVDVIVGGSPCQDFSIAGLRQGLDGHRGQLIWQYYRIIKEVMPPIFIYENVKGMVSDNNGNTLKDFLEVFRGLGYSCHSEVLNTKDYGIPQNRERVYIVGFLDSDRYYRFKYAPKQKLEKLLKDVLEYDVDEKYYLSYDRIDTIKKWNANKKPFENIHYPDSIHQCLTARGAGELHSGMSIIFDGRYRVPTPRECLRLQGFQDTFKQVVSNRKMYKQAGNSMSVNVLEMLFRQIELSKTKQIDSLF